MREWNYSRYREVHPVKIEDIKIDKKVDGITDVIDISDKENMAKMIIELKKDANAEMILNYLFKNTDLQVNYNFNMVAIVNRCPKTLGILEILDAYIAHQKEVIVKRSDNTSLEVTKLEDDTYVIRYLGDYAFTDYEDLVELEFDSISCFESSTTGYDISKVIIRYVNLVISIVALVVMNIICVILIYTVLKFRKNDYLILKMNGMSNNLCTKINTFEIMTYGIISYVVITIIVLIISMTTTNQILIDAFKYVRFYDYLILFGVTLITMGYIVKLYSKYLKNRVKISSISED